MEIGLIGLSQSGKTTLLSALTRGRSEVGTHGSGRQEVHAGVSRMADLRLDSLARIFEPEKVVPVEIRYWDVPAGTDAGITGQFLNLLQGADALLHVVRAFEDPSVPHVAGSVDPQRDMAALQEELANSDLAILERRLERVQSSLKGASGRERDILLSEATVIQRIKEALEDGVPVREQQVSTEENTLLSDYQLLTAKPSLVVFNVDESGLSETVRHQHESDGSFRKPGIAATSLCAKLEMELSQLDPGEEKEFRDSMGIDGSGVDRVVMISYELLSLVSFFTYVSKEVRAWTVPASTPAVKAAGRIHSDMERGFIRAEVIAFEDLAQFGSVAQCRKEGRLRLEGKTYQVRDGDVITFLFNV